MKSASFASLNLKPELLSSIESLGYTEMTAIQEKSLPIMLGKQDVIAQAETGSGKTVAFALAALQHLDEHKLAGKVLTTQTLVLCPTRELADQVAKEIRVLARALGNIKVLTLCGGVPVRGQVSSLVFGAHIIVGTPGRIQDHLKRETLQLGNVNTLVLDEADRMLDMGFQQAIADINQQTPSQKQTLLFSATYSGKVKTIAKKMMREPKVIKVESIHDSSTISQHFFELQNDGQRLDALKRILLTYAPESAVVFCNTKRDAQDVTDTLVADGFSALDLTGDLEQRDRDQTLIQFANKSISVLVATDVAARGLDIDNLDLVVNYHLAHDPESHIHRIGRTGRAGSKGTACSLFTPNEGHQIALFADVLKQDIKAEPLPPESVLAQKPKPATYQTLQIGGGKKQKLRAGDILGALTSEGGIAGKQVGKINIGDNWSYVAVESSVVNIAQQKMGAGKLKGKTFRVRLLKGL
ncbi:ATP-dependent RNA helicase DbpA [Ghiorsea bivora]|uniref:ATP-dependent RNA helicase DbpA n=1 Tax=Ghiorsea bivora TaxID=1485545 RepID=UPI0005703D52|nr:ATP-dependent RNA helicase DbpA [Ghiorsea bivora]